ncbi:MAG: dephospho-CoA kinase [Frankiaceae bacterium]|jgi:dephospho-CoA kinase|nr:dephospho-CoA kinase [Frankiaceae bacterium]
MPTDRRVAVRVGLTGGIASGKSEVARRLAERGAVVIDADVLARAVVAAGTPGHAAVVARFGSAIVGPDGELDRARLAELVFADADARAALNAIVHPLVRARAAELEAALPAGAIVVHDIPLLVESGQQRDFDVVVVVAASPQTQERRLVERRGMAPAAARARIAAQAPLDDKVAAADIVIDNEGSVEALDAAVEDCWRRLAALALRRMA